MFAPTVLALVVVACLIVFRRLSAALIPLSVVALASVWIFGVMGFLAIKINVISTGLLALTLAVGVADSIHILAEYYQQLMKGKVPETAVRFTLRHLFIPCLFTSMTTAAGLLSLMISDLAPVGQFGWLAALAVTFAFVLSVTFVPVILHLAKPPDPAFVRRQKSGPMSRLLSFLGRPTVAGSRLVLLSALLGLAAVSWGLFRLEIGSDPSTYLKADSPVRIDTEIIDQRLGGSMSVDFLLRTPPGGLEGAAHAAANRRAGTLVGNARGRHAVGVRHRRAEGNEPGFPRRGSGIFPRSEDAPAGRAVLSADGGRGGFRIVHPGRLLGRTHHVARAFFGRTATVA
ncbi:MAG: MMPL family transporter [Deltaproteobacteria bacterium]|nr:MMPL family transporter [Deltaproteobacteria bacterium]